MEQSIKATVLELIRVAVIIEKETPGEYHPKLNRMIEEKLELFIQHRVNQAIGALEAYKGTTSISSPESDIHEGHM